MKIQDAVQPSAPSAGSKIEEGDSFAGKVTFVGDAFTSTNNSLDKPREETQFIIVMDLTHWNSSHKKGSELEVGDEASIYMRLEIDGAKSVHPLCRAILMAAQEAGLEDTADLVGATLAVERGEDDEVPGRSFTYPTFTAKVIPAPQKKMSLADMA